MVITTSYYCLLVGILGAIHIILYIYYRALKGHYLFIGHFKVTISIVLITVGQFGGNFLLMLFM